jgi:hypothetical protein
MKKQDTILLILLLVGLYSFTIPKKLKGSIIIEPLDLGEYLPDDYNVPDYQD